MYYALSTSLVCREKRPNCHSTEDNVSNLPVRLKPSFCVSFFCVPDVRCGRCRIPDKNSVSKSPKLPFLSANFKNVFFSWNPRRIRCIIYEIILNIYEIFLYKQIFFIHGYRVNFSHHNASPIFPEKISRDGCDK